MCDSDNESDTEDGIFREHFGALCAGISNAKAETWINSMMLVICTKLRIIRECRLNIYLMSFFLKVSAKND